MSRDIFVSPRVILPARDLSWKAVRASGPGGQNVNEVASKVELRFDLANTTALDWGAKGRLRSLAAGRIDADGAIVIVSQATRSQDQNLEDARQRLAELVVDTDRSGPPTKPVVLTSSAPAIAIVDYAKNNDIDLIVLGTHGYKGVTHAVMGSVAERVVRMAPCPVLTVHHPEHDFVHADTLVAVARQ